MSIGAYIRRIGRKRGDGRALTRAEAADLMGQVLDRTATDFPASMALLWWPFPAITVPANIRC